MTTMRRLPAVCGQLGRGRTAVYEDEKAGLITPAVKVGVRAKAWPDYEIDTLAAARTAGLSDAEVKAVVLHLIAERKTRLAAILQPPPAGTSVAPPRRAARPTPTRETWHKAATKARE